MVKLGGAQVHNCAKTLLILFSISCKSLRTRRFYLNTKLIFSTFMYLARSWSRSVFRIMVQKLRSYGIFARGSLNFEFQIPEGKVPALNIVGAKGVLLSVLAVD